ncbi:PAS domain-containing protein [Stenotrophomonas sp. NPDC077464]|uniref:AraC family transcriptional regulator n=1 Tax=unclassified Stenotrophomonas TaxID=196198 RepID=UPI0037D30592
MRVEPADIEALFDAIPDVLFFMKDRDGRYTHINQTMLRRLGLKSRKEVIGRTAAEIYPTGLGADYATQDAQVLAGKVIENLMELHLFANREPGWCLTCKRPLLVDGQIRGLIGISRDLGQKDSLGTQYEQLRLALAHLNAHYAENVRMQTLLDITGFSLSKLERTFRKVFQMTPQQVLTRLRIQMAVHLLHGSETIASIGQACGFTDQSAFTRKFKAEVGVSPRAYRAQIAERADA